MPVQSLTRVKVVIGELRKYVINPAKWQIYASIICICGIFFVILQAVSLLDAVTVLLALEYFVIILI